MRKILIYAFLLWVVFIAAASLRYFNPNRGVRTIYNASLPAKSTVTYHSSDSILFGNQIIIAVDTNNDNRSDIDVRIPGEGTIASRFLFLHGAHPERKIVFERIGVKKNGTYELEYGIKYAKQ